MLLFFSRETVILMHFVRKTIFGPFSIKYWIISEDRRVKLFLKLPKELRFSLKIASTITNTTNIVSLSDFFFAFFFDRSAIWVDLIIFISNEAFTYEFIFDSNVLGTDIRNISLSKCQLTQKHFTDTHVHSVVQSQSNTTTTWKQGLSLTIVVVSHSFVLFLIDRRLRQF